MGQSHSNLSFPLFSSTLSVWRPLPPHLKGESVIGNRGWLSLWAKAAITQPLTDEAIGRCNQSQLSGLRYALYMGSNPDTAHRITDICVAPTHTHTHTHCKASLSQVDMWSLKSSKQPVKSYYSTRIQSRQELIKAHPYSSYIINCGAIGGNVRALAERPGVEKLKQWWQTRGPQKTVQVARNGIYFLSLKVWVKQRNDLIK